MRRILRITAIISLIGLWPAPSAAVEIDAKETTQEQIKGLDQQVQDIKKEVLDISTGLVQLEEKLTYPANSRLSIFLAVDQEDKFRLDAVNIKIDGSVAARHVYTPMELDALQHGGVQHLYIGNIRTGEHALEVALTGKSTSDHDYQQDANFRFTKDVGTKLIAITIAGSGSGNQAIFFRD